VVVKFINDNAAGYENH